MRRIDLNTETFDGFHPKAWRHRILAYETYRDVLLAAWKRAARRFAVPRLRIPFLTTSAEHAYHFLSLARELARNPDRHLFYAATLVEYLQDPNPLTSPLMLDHDGRRQAIVNVHPSAAFQRAEVQLPRRNVAPLPAIVESAAPTEVRSCFSERVSSRFPCRENGIGTEERHLRRG